MATKSNPHLAQLILELRRLAKDQDAPIWKAVAKRLEGPLRNRPEVNLSRVERYASAGETVVVPGKLLGAGRVTKAVTVAALTASSSARRKIEASGGKVFSIRELTAGNPQGKGLKILG